MAVVEWEDLTVEQMSISGFFEGKIFKTYSPLNEMLTFVKGHDKIFHKLIMISESTDTKYLKLMESDMETEIFMKELILFLLKHTAEEAAKEFDFEKI